MIRLLLALCALGAPSISRAEPVVGELYRTRYPLKNAEQKLVGNRGDGFTPLFGTRNLRAVLNGVYYRGGANNLFLPKPRDNSNPLPQEGLQNLCKEGFAHAVYLYSTNYQNAPKEVRCKDTAGNENTISYLQISPLAYREKDLLALLTLIHEHVRNPRLGPVYDHCWNGWHASGYVAATTLRQFCGFTAEAAVDYWNRNTDGNHDASYDKLRQHIRDFKGFPQLTITAAEKAKLCPAPGSLAFQSGK